MAPIPYCWDLTHNLRLGSISTQSSFRAQRISTVGVLLIAEEAVPRTKLRITGFDDPALQLALAVVGTMFIVVALLVDAALLAKAIVFGAGVVGTVLAFVNRKQ